jgi:CHASE2 domain-containing sensor protein
MQDISFAIAQFLEATFQILVALHWLPVVAFSLIMALGSIYWLVLQGRYNRQAREKGTLA